jgi:drug/metabolite transporter (DMT)-like permease
LSETAETQSSLSSIAPHLALVAVQILFGSWPIFGKIVLRSMSSTSLVCCRLTGAAIAFAILQRHLTPLWKMPRRELAWLALCSVLGVVGNQFLYVTGLSFTTAINASLLATAIPVFTLVVSVVLGHDKLSTRRLLGVICAATGVVYLINPHRADFSWQTTTGNLLLIANSFCYAVYIVISKDTFQKYGALNVITWLFVLGTVVTIPVGVVSMSQENLPAFGAGIWLAIGFIVIFPTVTAYYLNGWALTKVTPTTVAIYIYLQPLIAFGFAPVFLGEQLNYRTLIAAGLIFGGVAMVTWRGRSHASRDLTEHPDALAH